MNKAYLPHLVLAVREDIRCHRENGVSLNPYSTAGARGSWQRGFDGEPELLLDYDTPRQRGQLCAQLIKERT
jgi:hypothetical protein